MRKFLRNPISMLIFFSLLTPSLGEFSHLVSCLTSNDVKNFTVHSSDSSTYYKLLNFSIINLRFAAPRFPKPVAVILPDTKEQLENTVFCCRKGSWAIRIRSGGHSYEGLSSTAEENPFVIIDMMNLNRVSVDLESDTAWVEAGATLGETYYAIAESSDSKGFPAGSCPTVGSGGHIAGGGFGLLSRKYGLAADNVLDAILIDCNGRSLDRESMGEDVFWAIRGGGGGIWGVLYAWKIELLPVPNLVTGFIVSRPSTTHRVEELVYKWQFVAPKLEDDFYVSAFVGASLPETIVVGISATFKGMYLGPKSEALSIINRKFPELGILEGECKEMSWIDSIVYFSGLKNGSSVNELKDRFLHDKGFFKGKSDYVRVPIPIKGVRSMIKVLEEEPKGYIILDPYGGQMSRIKGHTLPFPHREGNLYMMQPLVAWNAEEDGKSDGYIDWLKGFYNFMTPFVAKNPRVAYVNYLDLDLGMIDWRNGSMLTNAVEMARVWGEKYFMSNYDRLVRAKTMVDPSNVFRNPQSIPPLPLVHLASEI